MGHEAGQVARQTDRGIAIRATDMDVLAVYRELLGQIAVQFRDQLVAFLGVYLLVIPVLEGVRATAGQRKVELFGGIHQQAANVAQFGDQRVGILVDGAADLDHALGNLRFDIVAMLSAVQ